MTYYEFVRGASKEQIAAMCAILVTSAMGRDSDPDARKDAYAMYVQLLDCEIGVMEWLYSKKK